MTKLEGPSILVPLALVVALGAAFIYRSQLSNLLNPNSCQFTAGLTVTGLDNQLRPESQPELTKLLSTHFKSGEEISASFSEQNSKLLVEGAIKRAPKQETSELSKKLGADPSTSVQVNTPEQAEASIRKVFSNIKPGRFAIYLSETDATLRSTALETLKSRFPNLALTPLAEGPIAALPTLPDDILWALRANSVAGDSHLFLIEFVYTIDVTANIYLVQKDPVISGEQVTRAEVLKDLDGFGDQETFSLAQDFDEAASIKLKEVTSKNVGGFLPLAIDSEAIVVPKITGTISNSARLSMGVSKTDPSGEISARRVLLSINSGKQLKDSLRLNLDNLKVTCE